MLKHFREFYFKAKAKKHKAALRENGKIGRVKKVYGKASRYDIDSPADDSEEYYKKYPEERKKDEEERAAAKPPKMKWTRRNIFIFTIGLIIITLMMYFCYKYNIQIW